MADGGGGSQVLLLLNDNCYSTTRILLGVNRTGVEGLTKMGLRAKIYS